MKKFQSILNKYSPALALGLLLLVWQALSSFKLVPEFMLPSPVQVGRAFIKDLPLLLDHSKVSLIESALGLSIGVLIGFSLALLMERFEILYKSLYPVLIISQTIPTVAIAPLLVLWFGYGIMPKVILIVIVTFFPIAIGFLDGFKSVDEDAVKLLKSMDASEFQILRYIKLPHALPYFFAGLRISASYSVVGAVIAEWLGGFSGLGVYMTRVKKSYSFDKMFAVIFLISGLSLLLMTLVRLLERASMPWLRKEKND